MGEYYLSEWDAAFKLQTGAKSSKLMAAAGQAKVAITILQLFEYLDSVYPDKFISLILMMFTSAVSYSHLLEYSLTIRQVVQEVMGLGDPQATVKSGRNPQVEAILDKY